MCLHARPLALHFLQIPHTPLELPCSRTSSCRHRSTKITPLINRSETNLSNSAKINQIWWWTRLHAPPKFTGAVFTRSTRLTCRYCRLCHVSPTACRHVSPNRMSDPRFRPAVRLTRSPDLIYLKKKKNQISETNLHLGRSCQQKSLRWPLSIRSPKNRLTIQIFSYEIVEAQKIIFIVISVCIL